MKHILLSFVLFGLLVAGGAAADHGEEAEIEAVQQAESVTITDLGVEDPGLLPTSRLYFFKEWGRGIRSFFTFNPVAKAELEERFANEKAAELKAVEEEHADNEEAITRALTNYQEAQERLQARLERLKETSENPNVDRLLHTIADRAVVHEKLLSEIRERHEDKAEVRAGAGRAKERVESVLERVAEKDVPEKFAERLKEAFEEAPGSAFKHIRSVEFLDEITEKMPEKMRERLEGVREGLKERVKERIEVESEDGEKLKAIFERIPGDKSRRAVILEEIRVRVSDQAGKALDHAQDALEKKIDIAEDREEKAAEQIRRAQERVAKAKEKLQEAENVRQAARELLSEAERHLVSAKEAFERGQYGEAFGWARAAEVAARNALRALEGAEENAEVLERVQEKVQERIKLPERLPVPRPAEPDTDEREESSDTSSRDRVICTQEYKPVCGVDGTTYSNRCLAERQKGVKVEHEGECGVTGPSQDVIERIEQQESAELEQTDESSQDSKEQRLEQQLKEQLQQLDQLQQQLNDTQAE